MLDFSLIYLVPVAIFLFLICHLLISVFIIKKSLFFQGTISFYHFDPNTEPPPYEVVQYIQQIYQEMHPQGFQIAGYLYQEGMAKGVNSFISVLQNPKTKESLYIYSLKSTQDIFNRINHSMEFVTAFDDGGELCTKNGKIPLGITKPIPGRRVYQFSSVIHCQELYKRHQLLSMMFFGQKRKRPKKTSDEVAKHLSEVWNKDFNYQVSVGLFYYQSSDNKYYCTVKGAIRVVLKMQPPLLQIRRGYRTWKNEFLLSKLREKHSASMQPYIE